MLQRPNRPDPLQYTHTLEEEALLAALRRRAMEEQEGTPIYEDSHHSWKGRSLTAPTTSGRTTCLRGTRRSFR